MYSLTPKALDWSLSLRASKLAGAVTGVEPWQVPLFARPAEPGTPVTAAAYFKAQAHFARLGVTDPSRAAVDLVNLLVMGAGATQYGPRPALAADPLIIVPGWQIGSPGVFDDQSLYLLVATGETGERRFPGGFCSHGEPAVASLTREAYEEVGCPPKDLWVKWVAMESSAPMRAAPRFLANGLHIISFAGLCVVNPKVTVKPEAGDDAVGFAFVRIFNGQGDPDWESVNLRAWRDDHRAMVARLLRGWQAMRSPYYGDSLYDFLMTLPNLEWPDTHYPPVPEVRGEYALPRSHNVQLAEAFARALMEECGIDHLQATESSRRLVQDLVAAGFVPYFNAPEATVDCVIVGTGENEDKVLLLSHEDGQKLPGRIIRQGESVLEAARVTVAEKALVDFTPLHFAGLASEWSGSRALRDPRGAMASLVYVGFAEGEPAHAGHSWVPLYDGGRFNRHLHSIGMQFGHAGILEMVANQMIALGVYDPCSGQGLLQSLQRNGIMF